MIYFNRALPLILGMPAIYFWFVLVPILSPIILGVLYLFDQKYNPQNTAFEDSEGEKCQNPL